MKLTAKLLEDYDNIVIEHDYFNDASSSILSHIQLGSRGRILMVVGPTGVGKTTLINFSVDKLNEYVKTYPERGFSPPITLEALAPKTGTFRWRSFYIRALNKLSEPGINSKSDIDKCVETLRTKSISLSSCKITTDDLGELFEQAIRNIKPIAIFIDEIQHLTKCRTTRNKTDNLDVIKSHSNTAVTSFILIGTYEAREMMYHGGQLSRRVYVEHFQRYTNNIENLTKFDQILRTIIVHYKIPVTKEVSNNISYFYNHSLGCVGILTTWIRTALEYAISTNSSTLELKHFQKKRLNNIQLNAILREISVFEFEHQNEKDFDINEFYREQYSPKKNNKETKTSKNSCKKKPFTTKPKRDVLQGM